MHKIAFSVAALLILAMWLLYFYQFGYRVPSELSPKQEVWGQFGDFLGGVLNPVLTFITMMFLAGSLRLQAEANTQLIEDSRRNERIEKIRKFEIQFFNLIDLLKTNFDKLTITINDTNYSSTKAVTEIENHLLEMIHEEKTKSELVDFLINLDSNDDVFSATRTLSLLIQKIESQCLEEHKKEYYALLKGLLSHKFICLIIIYSNYFEWSHLKEIEKSGIFDEDALNEYRNHYKC